MHRAWGLWRKAYWRGGKLAEPSWHLQHYDTWMQWIQWICIYIIIYMICMVKIHDVNVGRLDGSGSLGSIELDIWTSSEAHESAACGRLEADQLSWTSQQISVGVRWIDVTTQKCRGVWNKGWQATNLKRWWKAQHTQVCEAGEVRRKTKRHYRVWHVCLCLFVVPFLKCFRWVCGVRVMANNFESSLLTMSTQKAKHLQDC